MSGKFRSIYEDLITRRREGVGNSISIQMKLMAIGSLIRCWDQVRRILTQIMVQSVLVMVYFIIG